MSAKVLSLNTGSGARERTQSGALGDARRAIHPTMNR
jgi:hypothetical protein